MPETDPRLNHMEISELIVAEVGKSFVGNSVAIRKILFALLAGGHVLLEDLPGVGKTTLAMAFSKVLKLSCNRIQFTPDVMPADVTGFTVLLKDAHTMEYRPGAAMCNLLLADEINRASTRTQSALLEAMEENAVTVDGVTHALPQPFMVIATQNPSGSAGTQLLPESQTDRFMMRLSLGYPDEKAEMEMLLRKHGENEAEPIVRITSAAGLLEMRRQVSEVYVAGAIYRYILRLVRSTRSHESVAQGASPRGSVALTALSQAAAYVSGRDFVIPEDVQDIYADCIAHRLILTAQAKRGGISPEAVLADILNSVEAPKLRIK
ncbi:MoxR family ATPase [Christensenella minuta]|uniref:AAA family ATPase n=1 Tax=Christensenella minuta TaxID=626937 RepID=UPI002A801F87|nr:MoxR family ATPase [Christensenella minuta]MDY3750678.1 MoxR family ATPase [Christensenella minuta]